jgi:hypothetical protein
MNGLCVSLCANENQKGMSSIVQKATMRIFGLVVMEGSIPLENMFFSKSWFCILSIWNHLKSFFHYLSVGRLQLRAKFSQKVCERLAHAFVTRGSGGEGSALPGTKSYIQNHTKLYGMI